MKPLARADVEAIAALARLELTEAELEPMARDLTAILEHMEALAQLDTEGVEPMTHAVPMELPLRADQMTPSLPAETALAAAADTADGCFRVPKIIDTSGTS